MKGNYRLAIIGEHVTLVPYRRHHVGRYHSWMSSPELLEATASEPLSLEEEYEMQRSWRDDENKCTFIILRGGQRDEERFADESDRMLGDVNLFLNDYDDPLNAEIEIMIAEASARRKGFAKEALKLMIAYGLETLHLHRFYAKIGEANAASINLFKSLGFCEVNYVQAFKEYEFAFDCRGGGKVEEEAMMAVNDVKESLVHGNYNSPSTLGDWKNEED